MKQIFTNKSKSSNGILLQKLSLVSVFLVLSLLTVHSSVFAEGSKQLIPDPTRNQGAIQIWDGGAGSAALRTFMTYNASKEPLKRLNIKVCNVGEKVYLGIVAQNNDVFLRVKDPNGNTIQLLRVNSTGGTSIIPTVNKPNNYTSLYVNAGGSIINASGSAIASPNQFTYRMAYMNTMTGFIANYNEASAGPAVTAVATANGYPVANGYKNSFFFTASMTGDYFVEANPVFPDSVVAAGAFTTMSNRRFPFFDITVTDAVNKIQTGRVWSGFWDMTCFSFTNLFNGSFFVYTTDSIVTKLTLNNIQPFGFIVMCNSFGLQNTGNFVNDRRSRAGIFQSPEYKLFLNDPDINCYPTGKFGKLNSAPDITGCDANNRCVNINVDKAGKAQIILELSKILPAISPPLVDRAISFDLKVGANCVPWDTKDGAGTVVPAGVTIQTRIDYFTGITHLPMYDCERNLNGYSVSLVRPKLGGVPIPYIFWDDTQIPVARTNRAASQDATVYATSPNVPLPWLGNPIPNPVCGLGSSNNGAPAGYNPFSNTVLTSSGQCLPITNGCTTSTGCMNGLQVLNDIQGCVNSSGCHLWNWNASNSTVADYGNVNTINMWWYANILTTFSPFNPGYISIDAETRIPRTLLASGKFKVRDSTVCANNNNYQLSGIITSTGFVGTLSGYWKTALPKSIAGTFFPDSTSLTAIYRPSATDLARDSAKVYLYANNTDCPKGVLDSLIIRFSPSPKVTVVAPTNVCANNSVINLNAGTLTVASGVVWGGRNATGAALTGTFSPPTSLTPTYTLGTGETPAAAPGTVLIFIATTTGNGKCNPVASSQVTVTVNPAFTISIPGTTLICQGIPNQSINATISNGITTTTGLWSTSGDGKFGNGLSTSTVLNTFYTFGSNDKINNGVTLSLISTGNGNCNASSGNVVINMFSAPTAMLSTNPTVCQNNPTASFTGIASLGFTSLLWTDITPGIGSFSPSNNVLKIAFTPSTAEINSASGIANINFTVSKTGCLPASSSAKITINKVPTVKAGPAQTVCANNPTITLTGSIVTSSTGEGTSATWTGGGGTFFPSNIITPTTTGVTYTLSNAEVAANSTTLKLTSNNNGTCLPITDSLKVFVTPAPSINPLTAAKVCANNAVVTLTGVVNAPFSGVWSTLGSGSLVNSSTTGVYTASAADITSGSVSFTFTSTNNGTCLAVNRSTTLTFDAAPSISIGSNQTICANNPAFTLSGNVSGGASGVSWIGGTNASFSPSRTVSAPTYTPTAAEISAGLLTLSVTSTGNLSNCKPDTKSVTITFSPSPVVSTIGTSTAVCANNPKITLKGSVLIGGVTSTGIWTGGNGGNYSPSTGNNTVYTPTASDISSGSVLFTFTPNNVGNCLPNPTSALVGFDASPAVNPGPTQTICGNVGFVNLSGSVTFKGSSTSGIWTGGSGTFSPIDQTILNTKYFPSPAEISSKIVSLILTSTNSTLGCNAVSSTVAINFTDSPVVKAGNNQTICGNSFSPITFSSSVTNAPSFTWSCTGCNSGSFVNTNTLSPTYTPNATDKAKGTITFKLTSSGNNCVAVSDSFKISYTNAPVANAGPQINICTNDFPVQLAATGSQGTWSGAGVFSPNNATLNATYTPTVGQSGPGSFTLTYTTNATPGCSPVSSIVTVSVTSSPVVDAGIKAFVCANAASVSLNGANNTPTQVWTSDGTGIFSNPNILNPTFTPSNADILKGQVKFTLTSQGSVCKAATDTVSIIISPKPIVVSMADQSFCSNVTTLSFNGTVTIAGGGIWRTSGTGRFNNNTSSVQTIIGVNMATNYTPSAADLLLPSFTISLTSTLNGLCNAETKTFNVSFSSAPVVSAGPARTICSDKDTIQLKGQVTNAAGGFWTSLSSPQGTFNNASILNAIYTPTAAELASSSFTLRLTSQGNNGTCNAGTSDIVVTILSKPNPNPGSALTICADANSVALSGFSPSPFGGEWSSSGSGTFTTGLVTTTILGTTYTLSAGDKLSPSFILFLKSTGSTVCGQVVSKKVITVTPVPIVNPGSNLTICGDATGVLLSGSIPNASGGIWTTTAVGGLFVPNITSPFDPNASNKLDAIYQPSTNAKTNGEKIVLKLTNSPVAGCADVSKAITLTVNPKPTVTANPMSPVCADTFSIPVSGTFSNLTTGNFLWSTSSDGTFSPSASPLSPSAAVLPKTEYRPSITDKLNGTVNLTLSLNGNGVCAPVSSTVPLTITSIPTVSAGLSRTVCANINTITLSGSVSAEATAQQWSTSGSGTFSGINILNPTYSFSSSDKSAGQVTLTLKTTAQGNCKPVSSSIVIKIVPQPVANAGSAISICETTTIVGLSGSITTVSGSSVWSTNGTGKFTPSTNSLTASYIPSAADFVSTTSSVQLTLSTLNSGSCSEVSNSITLSFLKKPVVKAGSNKSICADASGIAIVGTVTGAGGGLWTSKRGGTFTPNPNSLNITYKPSAAALTALNDTLYLTSTGNAPCSAIRDTLVVKISPVPTVSAGPDISFCSTFDAPYNLSLASVSGATGIKWTTSGNGRFIPSDSATNPQYDKGLTDVASGGVTLTATTYGNGPCGAQTAKMRLKYDVAPSVSAGPILTYCADDSPAQSILINGSVNGKSATSTVAGYTFDWRTNGSGTFVDNTQFVPSYVPSDLDKILGNVQFTFSATNNGSTCGSVSSSTNVFLTPPPVVSPGVNRTICPSQDTIVLNGSFSVRNVTSPSPGIITNGGLTAFGVSFGAGTVTIPGWTDLGFGFFANGTTTATSATFYPVNGVIPDWTLVSTGLYTSNGVTVTNSNNFINGTATILGYTYDAASGFYISGTTSATGTEFVGGTYLPSPWSLVPPSAISPNPASFSNGLVTVSGGAFWSSTSPGATFSTSNTLMNGAVYQITAADRANGQVVISLNSSGFGSCTPVKNDMIITFAKPITVNPGTSQSICSNNPTVSLTGTVIQGTNTFTGISGVASWSSPSGGTFSNINSLNTTFTPTTSQINSGQVTLFLTSSASSSLLTGSCTSVKSSVVITFTQPTSISAGNTVLACQDASTVAISGNLGVATVGGRWSTSGTGTFANATSLGTNYLPSNTDKSNGIVTLSLTSINNGNCSAVTSTVQLAFTPSLTLSGANLSVCADANSFSLSGFPTFVTVPGWNYLSNGYFNSTNTITGGVNWTTTSVGGTFSNVLGSISTTSYNLTATDITNGNVVVKLNTTGFGSCQTRTADYNISIISVPTVNITAPSTVCGALSPIALSGTVTGATGGIWSSASGAGDFGNGLPSISSSGTSFNVNFTPTAAQITGGKVAILLTITNTGLCKPVTKSTTIFFQSPPTIQAGSNISTCTVPSLNVSGTLSLPATPSATNPVWSSNGTGLFSTNTVNGTNISSVYTLGAGDSGITPLTLCMTSTANGICTSNISSCLTVNFVASPNYTIATPTPTICGNNLPIQLSAAGPSGTWITNGAGVINNPTSLNATYTPTALEISSGATIIFNITSSGICGLITPGTITSKLIPGPTVGGFATPTVLCKNNTTLDLSLITVSGATSGVWKTSGNGQFIQGGVSVGGNVLNYSPFIVGGALTYVPSSNDITSNSVVLKFVTSNNLSSCKSDSANVNVVFTPSPTVNGGGNQSYCVNVPTITLTGSVSLSGTTAAGLTGKWSTTSTGSLVSTQNGTNVVGVYSPTATDYANGSVKLFIRSTLTTPGVCSQVSDSVIVTFNPLPSFAGLTTQTVCGDGSSSIQLQGTLSTSSSIIWTGGLGTFTPNRNTLNAFYQPDASETGTIPLFVQATSSGSNCVSNTATVNIAIQNKPTILVGGPYTICSNNLVVTLSASGTGSSGYSWSKSTGSGTLSSNNTILGTSLYTATAADVTSSGVNLIATSIGNGVCAAVSANTGIIFTAPPTINAGGNRLICINNPTVTLSGSFSGSSPSGVVWGLVSAGTGTFTGVTTTTSVVFTATNTTAPITISISSTGVNLCNTVTDNMVLSFSPSPVISGVSSSVVCGDTSGVVLNADVSVAGGIFWSGGTGIFVTSRNDLKPTYIPSDAEKLGSVVNFTLTTTGNGNCNFVQTSMTLTVTSAPTVTSTGSFTTCATNRTITLTGGFGAPASGAIWSTAGTGVFSSVNTLTGFAIYTASKADSAAGGATFQIKTLGNGLCKAASDTANLTITPAPKVDAGFGQSICADNNSITLNGLVTPYSSFGNVWTASPGATGTFTGSNALSTNYLISAADRLLPSITFTLAPATVGSCNLTMATSTVLVSFTPTPIVTASTLGTVCADTSVIQLNGFVTFGTTTSTGIWSGRTGKYSPNAALNSTNYILSASESGTTSTTGISFVFTSNNNGTCIGNYTTTVNLAINPAPTVVAPTVLAKPCENNPLVNLTATGSNANLFWSSTSLSTGTFTGGSPGAAVTYQPSNQEFAAGSVNLQIIAKSSIPSNSCKDKTVTFPISLDRQPEAQAIVGSNLSICKDQTTINLVGYVINARTTSSWNSPNGASSINPLNSVLVPGSTNTYQINASYTIDPSDITIGSVDFILNALPFGSCNLVTAQFSVSFIDLPSVTATSATICADVNSVNLTSTISTAASGVIWSGGNGTFSDASSFTPVYQPTKAELASGLVGLSVKTLNKNGCTDVSQNVTVNVDPAPSITKPITPVSACANTAGISLTGLLTNVTSAQWSYSSGIGTGTFTPINSTTTSFVPSASDLSAGTANVKITAYPFNTCLPVSENIVVNFQSVPVVSPGLAQTICADAGSVLLNGVINGTATTSSNVQWTTTGSGIFGNPNSSTTTYTPSASDKPTGSGPSFVMLNLKYTDPGLCAPVSEFVTITITSTPIVTAEINNACSYLTGVPLIGKVQFGNTTSTGTWTTSGTGSFTQSAGNINASYLPSFTDIQNGKVTLKFESTNQGTCNKVSSSVNLILQQLPVALPGSSQTVCAGSTVILVGSSNKDVSYSWSQKGVGLIGTNKSVSVSVSSSSVFYLTVTDANGCTNKDSVTINTVTPPGFLFNPTSPICYILPIQLKASLSPIAIGTTVPGLSTSYTWYKDETPVSNILDSVAINGPGSYNIVFNYGQCNSNKIAKVNPSPVIKGLDRLLCVNSSATLSVNYIEKALYTWKFQSSGVILPTGSISSLNITNASNESYLVSVQDSNNCISTDTLIVKTVNKPIINVDPVSACVNDTAILNGIASNIDTTIYKPRYNWYVGAFEYTKDTTLSKIGVTQGGQYKLIYTIGECVSKDSADVVMHPRPVTNPLRDKDMCEESDSAVGILIDGGDGFKYKWKSETESLNKKYFTGDSTRTIIAKRAKTYYVQVYNEFNCPTKDSIRVTNACFPKMFVADAFTPNGDQTNDDFKLNYKYINKGKFEFTVFSRWGEIIYYTEDPTKPWDGTYKNDPMPAGVYPWTMKYEGDNNKYKGPYNKVGKVTVIR